MNFSKVDIKPGIQVFRQGENISSCWVSGIDGDEYPCIDCPIKFQFNPPVGSTSPEVYMVGDYWPAKGTPMDKEAWDIVLNASHDSGLDLHPVRWANVVACTPTDEKGNCRSATIKEALNCMAYVKADIAKYKPIVLVMMGRIAVKSILKGTKFQNEKLTNIRGTIYGLTCWGDPGCFGIATWHPSYILHKGGVGSKTYLQFADDLKSAVNCVTTAHAVSEE